MIKHLLFIALLSSLHLFSNAIPFEMEESPQCHPHIDALLALYNSTDGPNWYNNDGWIDGAAGTDCAHCSWHGVICDVNDNVIELNIESTGLSGIIPSEIGQLANLCVLDLDANQITGSIPTELSQLLNLKTLSLAVNQLTGSIPVELSQLSNLTYLAFFQNQLSGQIPNFIHT